MKKLYLFFSFLVMAATSYCRYVYVLPVTYVDNEWYGLLSHDAGPNDFAENFKGYIKNWSDFSTKIPWIGERNTALVASKLLREQTNNLISFSKEDFERFVKRGLSEGGIRYYPFIPIANQQDLHKMEISLNKNIKTSYNKKNGFLWIPMSKFSTLNLPFQLARWGLFQELYDTFRIEDFSLGEIKITSFPDYEEIYITISMDGYVADDIRSTWLAPIASVKNELTAAYTEEHTPFTRFLEEHAGIKRRPRSHLRNKLEQLRDSLTKMNELLSAS